MDIAGLVYRGEQHHHHSSSSSSSAPRGSIMAPHMPMAAQPFVHDQMGAPHMGSFDTGTYPSHFSFDATQVSHYPGPVVAHPSSGFPASAYSHSAAAQHQQHPHQHHQHNSHPQHHHQHHQQALQHVPPTLATQRIPQQTISRDPGRAQVTYSIPRVPSQTPTVPSQAQNYAHHLPPHQSPPRPPPPVDSQNSGYRVQAEEVPQWDMKPRMPPEQQQYQSHQQPLRQMQVRHPPLPPPPPPLQDTRADRQQSPLYQRQQQQQQPKQSPTGVGRVGLSKITSPNSEVDFQTDVDTLMKAIQSKQKAHPSPRTPPSVYLRVKAERGPGSEYPDYGTGYPSTNGYAGIGVGNLLAEQQGGSGSPPGQKDEKKAAKQKRYECSVPGCGKSFFQKTHLDIHLRAHTGDKPFTCKEPGCGQQFSQLGNMKTHERRHTGEKPYSCDHCGKRFAQRGNVRAHKIVHDGAKPFLCKLDNCGKQFTQLGNLKSHQNKFHTNSLRALTEKFAKLRNTDEQTQADRELFEYFAELYKNSNRGIKGRGKDRKISGVKKSQHSETDGDGSGGGGGRSGGGKGSSNSKHHQQDQNILSPNGSCGSNSNADAYDYGGTTMDEDDGSPMESPYDQHAALPPVRHGGGGAGGPGGGGGGGGGGSGSLHSMMGGGLIPNLGYSSEAGNAMNMHTNAAKYSLDRKF